MTSKRMTRAEMIRWLGDAISTETEKPFEEIDYDFVEECGCLLDELMGKSAAMSEEEIAERIEKLKPDTTSAIRKKIGGRKLWKIVIAAAVVLCMSVTVMAIPELRAMIAIVLQLDVGESVENNNITYTYNGKGTSYADIDTLITTENLNILSYKDPEGLIKIINVDHITDIATTVITFNDPTISFKVIHGINRIDDSIINDSEIYTTKNYIAYLFIKDTPEAKEYIAYFNYENNTYMLKTTAKDILLSLLNSLKKIGD